MWNLTVNLHICLNHTDLMYFEIFVRSWKVNVAKLIKIIVIPAFSQLELKGNLSSSFLTMPTTLFVSTGVYFWKGKKTIILRNSPAAMLPKIFRKLNIILFIIRKIDCSRPLCLRKFLRITEKIFMLQRNIPSFTGDK